MDKDSNKTKQILPVHAELIERMDWLVKLRWLAIMGLLGVIFLIRPIFQIELIRKPLLIIAGFLFLYNLLLNRCLLKLQALESDWMKAKWASILAKLQVSIDLTCLLLLIHFSSGLENPFTFYFIFHVIIASILLTRRVAFIQTGLAIIAVLSLGILESKGIVSHYHLNGFASTEICQDNKYLLGVSFAFSTTMIIAFFFASSITARLRDRDEELVKVNEEREEKTMRSKLPIKN